MTPAEKLARGRDAFSRRRWRRAYTELSAADGDAALEAVDLERLAVAAYLIGEEKDAAAAWTRAHHTLVDGGAVTAAARCGFWLSLTLLLRGDAAQSAGWLARTERLLEDAGTDGAESGYVLALRGLLTMGRGDTDAACAIFEQSRAAGERLSDADLKTLSLLARGQALIQLTRIAEGLAALDEAMIAVTAGETSPIMAGVVYCAVILTCRSILDLRRAGEWTAALGEWCAVQPELVAFQGQCLVHRSEILQMRGDWPAAVAEAARACEQQAAQSDTGGGRAFYQQAELHRLCGRFEQAEQLYKEAGLRGCEPQPGLARLRLAQGDLAAAEAAIRRVIAEANGRQGPGRGTARSEVLGPYVEVMLAAGDVDAARAGAAELEQLAETLDAPLVHAAAAEAAGAVRLAEADATEALTALRHAWTSWQEHEAPYDSARVRVLIALACRQLGDRDTANIHFDAARSVFERLGAAPDLKRLERLRADGPPDTRSALTQRELEVLTLVAAGKTNREIAGSLRISEHTVARHVSNIFTKLDVTSRTAASAFAFEHGLVRTAGDRSRD